MMGIPLPGRGNAVKHFRSMGPRPVTRKHGPGAHATFGCGDGRAPGVQQIRLPEGSTALRKRFGYGWSASGAMFCTRSTIN